jgi:DNA-binding NtrC family response regulator
MMQRYPPGRSRTDLLGRAVLLVEGDFCEARDTQQALQHAGANVMGPFGDSESALRCVAGAAPSCAIIDIHVSDAKRFNVAEALLDKGVPVIFVTGDDSSMIPRDFSEVPLLQKPVDFSALLKLTAKLADKRLT